MLHSRIDSFFSLKARHLNNLEWKHVPDLGVTTVRMLGALGGFCGTQQLPELTPSLTLAALGCSKLAIPAVHMMVLSWIK